MLHLTPPPRPCVPPPPPPAQEYPNLFPGIEDALKAEQWLRQKAARRQPASR